MYFVLTINAFMQRIEQAHIHFLTCLRGAPFHSVYITRLFCRVNGKAEDFSR